MKKKKKLCDFAAYARQSARIVNIDSQDIKTSFAQI